jgi:peptidoglycan-associated lipoprotein
MTTRLSRLLAAPGARAALALTLLTAACSKPETAPAPLAAPTTAAPAATTPAATATAAATPAVDTAAERARREAARLKAREDSIAAARALASKTAAELKAALLAPVYFDYDKAELREDTRAALEAKLPVLQANSALKVRVQGHTDERGSDEYNLALGQRRAASVKRWFADRGVDERRIEIVSFGRERPAVTGEDEAARSKNRRAEFEILAGGEALAGPR